MKRKRKPKPIKLDPTGMTDCGPAVRAALKRGETVYFPPIPEDKYKFEHNKVKGSMPWEIGGQP